MGELGQHLDGGGINPNDVEPPTGNFDPMPAGWRSVEIEKAVVKPNSKKTGYILKMDCVVIGEKFSGRHVFPMINVSNPSAKCQAAGTRELGALGRACGLPFFDDEDKILGKQIDVKLIVKHDEGYEPDNEVKGFRALGGDSETRPTADKQAPSSDADSTPPASGEKKPMPWEKK